MSWLLLLAACAGLWGVARLLTWAGKTSLTVILTAVLVATACVIVAGIRAGLRSTRNAATSIPTPAGTTSRPATAVAMHEVTADESPAVLRTSGGRPRLRIVRDEERAA